MCFATCSHFSQLFTTSNRNVDLAQSSSVLLEFSENDDDLYTFSAINLDLQLNRT